MRKSYLLIAGDHYYPSSRTGDWIARYETYAEAEKEVQKTNGRTDGSEQYNEYLIKGNKYDWFDIVDLDAWGM